MAAKKEATKSLLDDVLLRARDRKPGFKSWIERLPPEAQAELDLVRQAFDPRLHQKNAYADSIMQCCRERGWPTAGRQGIIDWLNRR